jgi:putative aldouronate transport system substrate-binding protein
MREIKQEYLPKVVMAPDFEEGWKEYLKVYESCNPKAFLDEVQPEVDRRIELAEKAAQ